MTTQGRNEENHRWVKAEKFKLHLTWATLLTFAVLLITVIWINDRAKHEDRSDSTQTPDSGPTINDTEPTPQEEAMETALAASAKIHEEMSYSSIPTQYLNPETYSNLCEAIYIHGEHPDRIKASLMHEILEDGHHEANNLNEYEHLMNLVDYEWCQVVDRY